MKVFRESYANITIQILYWIVISLSLCICFFLLFGNTSLLLSLQYILFFLPSYWLLFPTLLLVIYRKKLTKIKRYTLLFIITVSFSYLDFQVNIDSNSSGPNQEKSYTLITANIGEGIELSQLGALVKFYHPDFLVFQEAGSLNRLKTFKDYPFIDCEGNLCFLSKHKYKKINSLHNSMFSGYGNWAVFYELELDNLTVNIANIHFPSVRKIFNNLKSIDDIHSSRVISANIVSEWGASKINTIISGDFNMSVNENTYQHAFAKYQNALSDNGLGFNNTVNYIYKGFTVPGIRIDHILFSQDFHIEKSIVLESLGGDHYPVLSTFTIKSINHD